MLMTSNNASSIFDPIMFSDDTNLFHFHKNINQLFTKVNEELEKIGDWFIAKKLSLNNKKYTLFHKNSIKYDLTLKLPDLKIAKNQIERKKAIKFLGVMLDEM